VARHEIRVQPYVDTLLLVAERAWEVLIQVVPPGRVSSGALIMLRLSQNAAAPAAACLSLHPSITPILHHPIRWPLDHDLPLATLLSPTYIPPNV
jgi:hypothetical protein